MRSPSVGDIVHYVSRGSADGIYPSVCRAAIVTAVDTYMDGTDAEGLHIGHVNRCVFNPEGLFFNRAHHESAVQLRGGTWHWPEQPDGSS